MDKVKQQIQELEGMLASGMVNDPKIIENAKEELAGLKGQLQPEKEDVKPVEFPEKIGPKSMQVLEYNLDPSDKHLGTILRSFISKDRWKLGLNVVKFEKEAVIATDAVALIRLKGKTNKQGLHCVTSTCLKNTEGEDLDSLNYPDYQQIIQYDDAGTQTQVDLVELYKVLLLSKTLSEAEVIQLENGNTSCFVNLKRLLPIIKALLQMGQTQAKLSLYGKAQPICIYNQEADQPNLTNDFLVLLMPMLETEEELLIVDLQKQNIRLQNKQVTFQKVDEHYPFQLKAPKSSDKPKEVQELQATETTETKKKETTAYNWKTVIDLDQLIPFEFTCQHYHLPVK
ncbi:MAG: hypothetical protein AAF242_07375, partial [Bacteroidota bacterium]